MANVQDEGRRHQAEQDALYDLNTKSVEDLLTDIHQEAISQEPNTALVHVLKRYAAIGLRSSRSQDASARKLEVLTKRIVSLTWVLVILTVALVILAFHSR